MKRIAVIVMFGLVAVPTAALADVEGWSTVDFRATVWKVQQQKLTLRTTAELQVAGRSDGVHNIVASFAPMYTPVDWFTIAVGGAYEGEVQADHKLRHEGRIEIEPTFHWKAGSLVQLASRNRLEVRFFVGSEQLRYRSQWRVVLGKDGWPVRPFVADELFVQLTGGAKVNQNRLSAGLAIPMGQKSRLDFSYMLRSRLATAPAWEHDHIFVLNVAANI